MLRELRMVSYAHLTAHIQLLHKEWSENSTEPFVDYASEILITQNNLSKQPIMKLMALSHACNIDTIPHSPRMLFCGSKNQIRNLQIGDTIITPEGISQIDSDFQEHAILDKTEMALVMPSSLIPTPNTPFSEALSNSTDETTREYLVTSGLNSAIATKKNGLYLCQADSIALQQTQDVITALRIKLQKIILPNLSFKRFFSSLKINNQFELHNLVKQINDQWMASQQTPVKVSTEVSDERSGVGADEEIAHYVATLTRQIRLHNMSDANLYLLSYETQNNRIPPICTRIIRAASLEQLENSDYELEEGDTIILPEAVLQYKVNGELHSILKLPAMQKTIPSGLIPSQDSEIQILNSCTDLARKCVEGENEENKSEAFLLTKALNIAMQNHPNAVYIGEEALQYRASNLLAAVHAVTVNEITRRKLKNNLIIKTLHFKNDIEFMHYWTRICSSKTSALTNLTDLVTQNLQQPNRVDFSIFSNDELKTLSNQCDIWSPKISPRILFCTKLPADYQIGDTVILPDGVYQMRVNLSGNIKQEQIMDKAALDSSGLLDLLPDSTQAPTIYHDYSKPPVPDLLEKLNPIIRKNPKGIYLSEIPFRANESHLLILIILKKMALQELSNRALTRFQLKEAKSSVFSSLFRLFKSKTKVVPTSADSELNAQKTMAPTSEMSTKQLRTATQQLKHLQRTDPLAQHVTSSPDTMLLHAKASTKRPRTLNHVEDSVQNVVSELQGTLGNPYQYLRDDTKRTVQITRNNDVVMEASTESVAVYKPLLKTKMDNQTKADLFLQALGIPPTQGKNNIVVHGGNRALREAIRSKFQEYKQIEQLASEQTASDTHSNSSKHSKR